MSPILNEEAFVCVLLPVKPVIVNGNKWHLSTWLFRSKLRPEQENLIKRIDYPVRFLLLKRFVLPVKTFTHEMINSDSTIAIFDLFILLFLYCSSCHDSSKKCYITSKK
jgi:hypothetical protein